MNECTDCNSIEYDSQDVEKCEWGYRVKLRITKNFAFDERLFDNTCGFSDDIIEVIAKTRLPLSDGCDDARLVNVNQYGLVVAEDSDDDQGYGFRNFLLPWSQVVFLRQRIRT